MLFCLLAAHRKATHRQATAEQLPLKVSDISKMLHVTAPAVTQMLKNLEASGLVERNPDPTDRRVVYVTLTARGEETIKQAKKGLVVPFQGLVKYLGEQESNQLAELLNKAQAYFGEHTATPEQIYQLHKLFMNGEAEA